MYDFFNWYPILAFFSSCFLLLYFFQRKVVKIPTLVHYVFAPMIYAPGSWFLLLILPYYFFSPLLLLFVVIVEVFYLFKGTNNGQK